MSAQKQIYGLIGYPVKHSLSKQMQEAAFSYCGINAEYRLIPVEPEKLEGFLTAAITVSSDEGKNVCLGDLAGFNITIPHKVRAFEIGQRLAAKTAKISDYTVLMTGAINTVRVEKNSGRLSYANTDPAGFMSSLREDLRFNPLDKKALVFGCGGAGRAVITALTPQAGFAVNQIYIYDADEIAVNAAKEHFKSLGENFRHIKNKLEFILAQEVTKKAAEVDLLVNATAVGMKEGDGSIIDSSLLHKDLFVYDVVYNRETQLIKDAKGLGLSSVGGLGMLLYQGAAAFEFWLQQPAPVEVMRRALEEGVKGL